MWIQYMWILIVGWCLVELVSGQTVRGNSNGAPCVFPFKYDDKLYSTCIMMNHDVLWCSTTKDYNLEPKWGECEAEDLQNLPIIDMTTKTNITVEIGGLARLPCKISNLGRKVVSWQKKGQNYPLTVAVHSFLTNGKFIVERFEEDHWNLIINNVQASDRGIYVCRVTTRTMLLTREVRLLIQGDDPNLKITTPSFNDDAETGNFDIYLEKGSELKLICNTTITQHISGQKVVLDRYVEWFKDDKKIDSSSKSKIMIVNLIRGHLYQSTLSLDRLESKDLGNYYCTSLDKTYAKFAIHLKENSDTRMSRDQPLSVNQLLSTPSSQNLILKSVKGAGHWTSQSSAILVTFTSMVSLLGAKSNPIMN